MRRRGRGPGGGGARGARAVGAPRPHAGPGRGEGRGAFVPPGPARPALQRPFCVQMVDAGGCPIGEGWRRMEAAPDGAVDIVPLDRYDPARAKIAANLQWICAKAYGRGGPGARGRGRAFVQCPRRAGRGGAGWPGALCARVGGRAGPAGAARDRRSPALAGGTSPVRAGLAAVQGRNPWPRPFPILTKCQVWNSLTSIPFKWVGFHPNHYLRLIPVSKN